MQLLHQGNARRSQAATSANETSSRSHAVLQINVESQDKAPGLVANIKVGKLSLVDLAGSERAANTKNSGVRLVEGANINRSLLALGNCINALGEKGNKGNFVPYRDSKLTRLLKDSLGGNCRTVMIAAISSAESSFEETLNTLKYANRAKNIKSTVRRNVLNVDYHISEYVSLINILRNEIKDLKDQLHTSPISSIPSTANRNYRYLQPIENNRANDREPTPRNIIPLTASPSFHRSNVASNSAIKNSNTGISNPNNYNAAVSSINVESVGRDVLNKMRAIIVENFQERMQLRRSLIELEDQNAQNSIEISKRQILLVQQQPLNETSEAYLECEQLKKAIVKNNGVRKNIAKRLRANEKEAEALRLELDSKVTGEDKKELMELQYQVGRLELENMELEQHRIVHESILKGKDLTIQKLKLQIALRDKILLRQQERLLEYGHISEEPDEHLSLIETSLLNEAIHPSSPLKSINHLKSFFPSSTHTNNSVESDDQSVKEDTSNTNEKNSAPPENILQPLRYSPRGKTPLLLSSGKKKREFSFDFENGSALKRDDEFRPISLKSPSNGRESRSLLTLSMQRPQQPADDHDIQIKVNRQNSNGLFPYVEEKIFNIDDIHDTLLNSRDRKSVEEGDWSEVPNLDPVGDIDESSRVVGEGNGIYGGRVSKSMNTSSRRINQEQRYSQRSPFYPAMEEEDLGLEESYEGSCGGADRFVDGKQPYRPNGLKKNPTPRETFNAYNKQNSEINLDGDVMEEIEPSLIQVNSTKNANITSDLNNAFAPIRPIAQTKRIVDKLIPLPSAGVSDAVEYIGRVRQRGSSIGHVGGLSGVAAGLPYDMMLQLPKKSPRGRLLNANNRVSPRPLVDMTVGGQAVLNIHSQGHSGVSSKGRYSYVGK